MGSATPELALIEARRSALGIDKQALERAADLPAGYYGKLVKGDYAPRPATLARLKMALTGPRKAHRPEGFELRLAYRMALALAAIELGADAATAQNADPARRATQSAAWMRASEVRRLACYLLNVGCGLRQTDVARAAGMTKQAVSLAVREIFDSMEADPARSARLDRLAASIIGEW